MGIVRAALRADEAALFDLLMSLRDSNNSFGFDIDDERVREHIEMGTRGNGGLHGIIDAPDRPGVLAGSIGVIWDRWWFSKEWGLSQIWLYVREEYRSGTHYADALVDWAKGIRAGLETAAGQPIRMANTVISQMRLEAKLRFWRRHSGEMIGAVFEIKS